MVQGPRREHPCHRRADLIAPRTLSLRELNRATLARQLLLRRHRLPLSRAVERVAGLQGQWPPSPYVGLWSRVEGFRREALERALIRRQIVKVTLMRTTLHLVTARDYPVFNAAINDIAVSRLRPEALEIAERVAAGVRSFFGKGSRTRREVMDWLERQGIQPVDPEWIIWFALKSGSHLAHDPNTALWKSRPAGVYVALDGVVAPDPGAARVEVVRRYLGAFGPATRADLAKWSGLRVADIAPALDALEPLRRFRDEQGRELLDLPKAPLPPADTPAPVRFLPKWDNLLLAYADRRRVIAGERLRAMIAITGEVSQSLLVDGMVAGTWSVAGERVMVKPFDPLPWSARREVEEERSRLEAFVR